MDPADAPADPARLVAVSVVLLVVATGGAISVVPAETSAAQAAGTGGCAGFAALPGAQGLGGLALVPAVAGERPSTGSGSPGGGGTAPYYFDARTVGVGIFAGHAAYVYWIDFAALNVTAGALQFAAAAPSDGGTAAIVVELNDVAGNAVGVYDSARSAYTPGANASGLVGEGWACGATTPLAIGETIALFAPIDLTGRTFEMAAAEPAASGTATTSLSFPL